jgi:hypothetical protein
MVAAVTFVDLRSPVFCCLDDNPGLTPRVGRPLQVASYRAAV